jgi:hypothetical protein
VPQILLANGYNHHVKLKNANFSHLNHYAAPILNAHGTDIIVG